MDKAIELREQILRLRVKISKAVDDHEHMSLMNEYIDLVRQEAETFEQEIKEKIK